MTARDYTIAIARYYFHLYNLVNNIRIYVAVGCNYLIVHNINIIISKFCIRNYNACKNIDVHNILMLSNLCFILTIVEQEAVHYCPITSPKILYLSLCQGSRHTAAIRPYIYISYVVCVRTYVRTVYFVIVFSKLIQYYNSQCIFINEL